METKKRSHKDKKHKKKHRTPRSRSRSRSPNVKLNVKPQPSETKEDAEPVKTGDDKSLSIEETNKLRAMLGLKPLQVPGSSNEETAGGAKKSSEVFIQTRNMGRDREAERLREKLELIREKRRVAARVTESLTEDNVSVDDVSSWVKRSREIELAKEREKLLAETDEQIEAVAESKPHYSSRDLSGIRVGHSLDKIRDERPVILTLKDKPVLEDEDEGDILENVNLVDDERTEQNIANKKASKQVSGFGMVRYNPYDDDGMEGTSLLKKYDDDLEGPKKEFFVLSSNHEEPSSELSVDRDGNKEELSNQISNSTISMKQDMDVDINPLNELRNKLKSVPRPVSTARPAMMATTSLSSSGPVLASEYYTPQEMATKFKKVKKVKKPLRTLKADDLLDSGVKESESNNADTPMEEDSDRKNSGPLSLAKLEPVDAELKATLQRTKKILESAGEGGVSGSSRKLPEHVAVDLLAQTTLNSTGYSTLPTDGSNWVLINQTSEFCRGVGELPTVSNDETDNPVTEGNDEKMEVSSEESEKGEKLQKRKTSHRSYRKKEDSDDETRRPKNKVSVPRKADIKNGSNDNDDDEETDSEEDEFVLGYEPKAASSVAEALKLASMKGYLEKSKGKSGASGGETLVVGGKVSQHAAQKFHVEERSYGDIDAKFSGNRRGGGGGGTRDRLSGPIVDFCEKDTYQPDVKLEYINESGNVVDQKEAFRWLSHRFHGKTSGKRKVEKRLKKEAQERRILSQASSDTPLHMVQRLQQRQQKEKQAFVVLSSSGATSSATGDSPAKKAK